MSETYFYRESKENNYTMMSNVFIRDKRLTMQAKGLFCYFMSLPEDWKIYIKSLPDYFSNGIDSIRTTIRELEKYGYVKYERKRNEIGVIIGSVYHIIEEPETEEPYTENPSMGNPYMGKPDTENPTLLITNSTNNLSNQTLVGNEPASGNVSDGGDIENTENTPKDKYITLDADELFEKAYKLYPRKDGKATGKRDYLSYLTNGRKIKGQSTLKYTHGQISVAIQAFSQEMTGRDADKIQLFSTFMHTTVVDYIEKTQKEYEAAMLKKYKDGWEKLRFKYTYKGQKPEKPKGSNNL